MIDLKPGGPYSPERTAEAAEGMAELARYLGHATRDRDALCYPNDLDRVVASVETMAHRMPQVMRQLQAWLRNETGACRTEVTYGQYAGRADLAYDTTAIRLETAAARFADAARALEQAHQVTSAIGATE